MCYQQPHNHSAANPPEDMWLCYECNSWNVDWCELCPICGKGRKQYGGYAQPPYQYNAGYGSYRHA